MLSDFVKAIPGASATAGELDTDTVCIANERKNVSEDGQTWKTPFGSLDKMFKSELFPIRRLIVMQAVAAVLKTRWHLESRGLTNPNPQTKALKFKSLYFGFRVPNPGPVNSRTSRQ